MSKETRAEEDAAKALHWLCDNPDSTANEVATGAFGATPSDATNAQCALRKLLADGAARFRKDGRKHRWSAI